VVTTTPRGPLTSQECPESKSGGDLDYFADTPVETWQKQAAHYVGTTLSEEHPDTSPPVITDQTSDALEVSFFGPSGHRVARLWFHAYKGGWRLETTEECASSPP
jgi:hypothetical protein